MRSNTFKSVFNKILLSIVILTMIVPIQLLAETAASIKSKISDNNSTISALNDQITQLTKDLENISNQKDTLANTLKTLDLTKKKLEADIKLTQKKIDAKNIEISGLTVKISDTGDNIDFNKKIVAKSFATMNELADKSLVETLLSSDSVSTALDTADQVATLQTDLRDKIDSLKNKKTSLETNKKSSEKARSELLVLSKQLSDQKKVVQNTTNEKNALLKETKDSEVSYQKLLADRKAQKEALEIEISKLEDALKIVLDPNSIPTVGSGILKYPLNKIRITQYFGNTPFATKNPQIYKSGSHPGVDFAASIGTPVRSAMEGIVVGSGNMDTAGGGRCRAYGKWIMIKHPNGLSTLYGHLSLIDVSNGQSVQTGEMIGYSGNTGASTGPHLHFGVYATAGVRITNLVSSSYCNGVLYPLADPKAYLNPLSYL